MEKLKIFPPCSVNVKGKTLDYFITGCKLWKMLFKNIKMCCWGQWRCTGVGWAGCDRNDSAGAFCSNGRGGLVTQAALDDSPAGKGWRRESIIAPGGSWGLEHQRISIKEVSVWGSGRWWVRGVWVGFLLIVPTVIESKRRGVGRHCVCSSSEEGGY